MQRPPRSAPATSALVLGVLALAACHDAADREHLAFLRGEEDDSTEAQRLAHLDRAIELAPDRARYFETRGTFLARIGQHARALRDLDHAIARADRPYLRYERALVFCELGQPARALADLERAIAAQSDNPQFGRARARARLATPATRSSCAEPIPRTGPVGVDVNGPEPGP